MTNERRKYAFIDFCIFLFTRFGLFALQLLGVGGLLWFTKRDLGNRGARYLSMALGIQSDIWIWIWILIGLFLTFSIPVGIVSVIYTRFTGRDLFYDHQIGVSKYGGLNIGSLSGLLCLYCILYFSKWIPAGFLGPLRPFVVVVGATRTRNGVRLEY